MSLSEARKAGAGVISRENATVGSPRRAPAVLLASVALTTLLLTGCSGGVRPLYATASLGGTSAAEQKLAQVQFAPIPGRVGQRIRNELIFESTGGAGEAKDPVYRLEIAITESVTQTLTKIDGNSLSSVYNLNANFKLVRLSDKKVVLSGASAGRASFERVQSVFANVRAKEDAENRAAKTVGDEMKGRLAIFLASQA